MIEVRVYSTETGRDAYFEISAENEGEVINFLQGAGFAEAFNRLLELV